MTITAGERFARAIAARDAAALRALLADPVSFTALTPGRPWQADSASEVIDEIILGRWFARVLVMELQSVGTRESCDIKRTPRSTSAAAGPGAVRRGCRRRDRGTRG